MIIKHIEFVKEWLADESSKTQAQLEVNARAAAVSADANEAFKEYSNAVTALRAYGHCTTLVTVSREARAVSAAINASRVAVDLDRPAAKHWVKRYEELTNDN